MSKNKSKNSILNDKEFEDYYLKQNKTITDLSIIYNCHASTVRNKIKSLGISRAGRGTSDAKKYDDLTGTKYGFLTCLKRIVNNKTTSYKCVCVCGNELTVHQHLLLKRKTISCKTCSKNSIDLSGAVFGKLTILNSQEDGKVKCVCSCGNKSYLTKSNIFNSLVSKCRVCVEYDCISKSLWKKLVSEAKNRRLVFDLTPRFIAEMFYKQKEKCALSGIKIIITNNTTSTTASLDRIDSSVGYVESNVQWVHKKINMMKSFYKEEEYMTYCKYVARGPKTKKNILITGANSMIGRQITQVIDESKYNIFPINKEDLDLLVAEDVKSEFMNIKPDIVLHLATRSGGISENLRIPFDIYNETLRMGINVINASLDVNLEKFVFIVPSCALNPESSELFEKDLYEGKPHPSVECHGMAKRAVECAGRMANKQFGLNFVTCIANNSFGPYDRFSTGGKVISGMIQKFYNAKINNNPYVELLGTGKPLREFIYCKDVAQGLYQVIESTENFSPINLTSDYEISIHDLAYKIKNIINYEGDILFDSSKPDGQMRKKMNSDKMRQYLDINITDFDVALKETIDWYVESRKNEQLVSNS